MGTLKSAWLIARRRLASNRGLLTALLLGVLVASTLLASTPIYARAMADLGLRFAVQQRLGVSAVTHVYTAESGAPIGTRQGQAVLNEVQQRIQQRLGWFSSGSSRFVRMPSFTIAQPGQPVPTDDARPQIFLQSFDGYEGHVKVLSGTLPQPVSLAGGSPPELQIALSSSGADKLGLHVGDYLVLGDVFDDCQRHPLTPNGPPNPPCTPHVTVTNPITAVVTAIVAPSDPKDAYWGGGSNDFFVPPDPPLGVGVRGVAFVPVQTLQDTLVPLFGTYWAQQQW
ncbi:MAG TPA: hypothetical protein VFA70_01640, partial [Dehalococcoidia bacterium]|nr:hypothetical protein [Dehalococcoidia bacterium]